MKINRFWGVCICVCLLAFPALSSAQDAINGFVLGKGKADLALAFTYENYDEFYRGGTLIDLPPALREYTVKTWSAYLAYGLTDNIDIIANIPYITASADADPSVLNPPGQEEKGLQDGALFIKWRLFHRKTGGAGELSIVTAAGVSFPLSDYVPDTPVSIGNHSVDTDVRLNIMYKFDFGFFGEIQGGYSMRSDEVPDAYMMYGKVGFCGAKFYADAWLRNFTSTEGTDIGEAGFSFPSNKVDAVTAGATLFYSIIPRVGATLKWWTVLDGRNVGKADIMSAGLVFRF
jgi:membrane-associated phospholipid phosphatase